MWSETGTLGGDMASPVVADRWLLWRGQLALSNSTVLRKTMRGQRRGLQNMATGEPCEHQSQTAGWRVWGPAAVWPCGSTGRSASRMETE